VGALWGVNRHAGRGTQGSCRATKHERALSVGQRRKAISDGHDRVGETRTLYHQAQKTTMYCDAYTTEVNGQIVPIAWGTSQYPPKRSELIDLGCDLPTEDGGDSPRYPRVYAAARSSGKKLGDPVKHVEPAIRITIRTRFGIPSGGHASSKEWRRIGLIDEGLLEPAGTFDDGEWREDEKRYRYVEGDRFLSFEEEARRWADENREVLEEAARAAVGFEVEIEEGFEWMREARQMLQEQPANRPAYEEACGEVGAPVMRDQEIIEAGYAMKYGEFTAPHYDAETCVKMILAKKRFKQMGAKAKPFLDLFRRRRKKQEMERRANAPTCSYEGCEREATMNASLGRTCPEHYDDLSGI
jgi:hypothetical protein